MMNRAKTVTIWTKGHVQRREVKSDIEALVNSYIENTGSKPTVLTLPANYLLSESDRAYLKENGIKHNV